MLNATYQAVSDFSRLGLRAYSRNQTADLTCAGGRVPAILIAISNYGARLKAPGALPGLALGDRVDFSLELPEKGLAAGRIPCRITWLEEGEVEVGFSALLEMTMGEVQAAVDC